MVVFCLFYFASNLNKDEINTTLNLRPHLSSKLAADIRTVGKSPASHSLCGTVSAVVVRHQHGSAQVSVQEAALDFHFKAEHVPWWLSRFVFFMSGPPWQALEHLKMHLIRSIDDLEVFCFCF